MSHRSSHLTLGAGALAALVAAVPALADGNLVVSASPSITTGSNFTVSVDLSAMSASAVGAQLSLAYDAAEVEFVGVAGGDDFPVLIYSSHDEANDRVGFATGVNAPSSGIVAGNIAKVTFKALVNLCADSDAVSLTTGAFPNKLADNNGGTISFTGSNSISVSSYGAFALAGIPAGVTVPADAGFASAAVSVTAPTATDSCGAAATVNFVRSDGEASLSAPYPVGSTTISWSSTDPAGQSATGSTVIVVENHQLLTMDIDLAGSIVGSGSTAIRVKLSDNSIVNPVITFTAGDGASADVQVPVSAGYSCAAAADASHTLAQSRAVSIVGTKYAAASSYSLVGGDSTGDNLIDVVDFGAYVGDFGAGKNFDSRSNFNRDNLVNNADFGFVGIGFLSSGESCGSAFNGGSPRTRVSVRELRRAGMGDIAAGDLTGDGWLDTRDIAYYLEHGIPQAGLSND